MIRRYSPDQTDEMAALLKKGGVLAVPTDTVYGLCALSNESGSRRLYKIKQRPLSKPLPLMCSDIAQAESIAIVSQGGRRIMEHLMPGPLTLILKKGPGAPATLAGETAAIRLATSEPLRKLIEAAGAPVYMTSANRSGQTECKTLEEIELACPEIDGMMEGSVCFGQASTIADISEGILNIVRQGPVQRETIERVMEGKL